MKNLGDIAKFTLWYFCALCIESVASYALFGTVGIDSLSVEIGNILAFLIAATIVSRSVRKRRPESTPADFKELAATLAIWTFVFPLAGFVVVVSILLLLGNYQYALELSGLWSHASVATLLNVLWSQILNATVVFLTIRGLKKI